MKQIKHPSGTIVTITNKKTDKTVRIEVDSSLLEDQPEYNEPKPSYIAEALKEVFEGFGEAIKFTNQ